MIGICSHMLRLDAILQGMGAVLRLDASRRYYAIDRWRWRTRQSDFSFA